MWTYFSTKKNQGKRSRNSIIEIIIRATENTSQAELDMAKEKVIKESAKRENLSPGKTVRHLTKISSLFPGEVFPDKLCTTCEYKKLFVLCSLLSNWNYFWNKYCNMLFIAIFCSQFALLMFLESSCYHRCFAKKL